MVCTKHTVQTRKSYKGLKDVVKDISSESGYVTLKTRIALGTSLKLGVSSDSYVVEDHIQGAVSSERVFVM